MTDKLVLTYEERQALAVIRKLIRRKPEAAAAIMEGMSKEVAARALVQVRDELNMMLSISRAFSEAAGKLAEAKQPTETKETNYDDKT